MMLVEEEEKDEDEDEEGDESKKSKVTWFCVKTLDQLSLVQSVGGQVM